ncbi:MAG TPA: UDP-N-acetylmuramoyl-tripeptide--D-alanyl-D-alanine ligase [Dehalococcoidia bacterium]|nr:UDP-N-acetylmuramoyl-tripeptide--D-alanyl-D-alanine ligase [Dehalococcoidia bacterium]
MLTTNDVIEGTGAMLVSARAGRDVTFARGAIDSRTVGKGDLFFALHGENLDAHAFVPAALEAGAAGAVVARPVESGDRAVFQVSDPQTALQKLAAYWRRRHDARVIGVTGSVGKTTAKELIAAVLSARYRTLKSEANLNTEIGVPLTLLQLRPEHERAVLELGMYVPDDIALLAQISQPDVGVVMNVGPVHLERVGSIGRITGGKAELVEALGPDGLAVLNGDDARVASFSRRTRARSVLFGLSEQSDVRGSDVESRGLEGLSFTISANGESARVDCPLPGRHHVYPALAAAAVALNEGMTLAEIAEALREARVDLRLAVRAGINGSTLIDDSYNASPASVIAALDLLSELPGRRVAVLGHMRELGAAEDEGHRRVGHHAAGRCDLLCVVGEEASLIAEEARAAGQETRTFESTVEAAQALTRELRAGDHVLIKASRAVGLESLVEALLAHDDEPRK